MKTFFHEERKTLLPVEEDFSCPSLTEQIKKTRYALEIAYTGFDNATNPDLIDSYIYEINGLLKKYAYLNALAEKELAEVPELDTKSPIKALISHVFG